MNTSSSHTIVTNGIGNCENFLLLNSKKSLINSKQIVQKCKGKRKKISQIIKRNFRLDLKVWKLYNVFLLTRLALEITKNKN